MITYSDDNETLLSCTKDMEGKIVIPNGVKTIASHAFRNCYEISEIVLPDTISIIQSQAFRIVFITIEQPKLIRNIRV